MPLQTLHRTAVRAKSLKGQSRLTHGADTYYKKERNKALRQHAQALIAAEQVLEALEDKDDAQEELDALFAAEIAHELDRDYRHFDTYEDDFDDLTFCCCNREDCGTCD